MDKITTRLADHYGKTFAEHGATPKGVDWNDPGELDFRYGKMMAVLDHDFKKPEGDPSILDVGCGWGGLLAYCQKNNIATDFNGIDIVESMIENATTRFDTGNFICGDVFTQDFGRRFDYVICNAIMTQKLEFTIPEMEAFCDRLVLRMYDLCNYGIVFNFMSTRVNFMVDNLYYRNPVDLLSFCLTKVSPRVKIDHSYSSLERGIDKYFDYTVYIYKD